MNTISAVPMQDRVVIVTGAGSGIGRATTLLLLELGASVFATDRNPATLEETRSIAQSDRLSTLTHDVTSEEDWGNALSAVAENGRLDGLVNNAGIMLDGKFDSSAVDDLRLQYRINVEGPFLGMQSTLPLMRKTIQDHNAHPSIVNVSSIFGHIAGSHYAAYSASKGAIRMLSKAVAVELAAEGIRVNSVLPGPTATALGASHQPLRDSHGNPLTKEETLARWTQRIPMGRFGAAVEVANAIAFLLSDLSSYATGTEIVLDGAYSAS
ncbi:hypothetical protein GQ57_36515 [Burkholderia sp. MSh2]|uniref:Short-chain dehydrogenase n=1 Tax=Burkholderia paludis TaxID=1506587 RepID=A0A6J5F7Z0_9BURK|nr:MULTISPECIES: SDR family oxidoreductase [Burkholderia]KEZ01204.1 hypothetical protein GQ57_36515 [Burkholderia sp. MSh2]CAB3773365.1 Cyclopentanol dehydrogenase [Burkholderia paludis]VWC45206.1 short-chain dehydrogenase [Burkholderia paludis]